MDTQHRLQQLRLGSGLVLFGFLVTHFLNHALGLAGLEAMEWGRTLFVRVWRHPLGTLVLYAAFALHATLVLHALYRRRALRMPGIEALQVALGFLVPMAIATHVIGTRGAHEMHGVADRYAYVVLSTFVFDWREGLVQAAAVLIAWTHAVLGLYFWLRLKPWFPRFERYLFAVALLLPAAALAGYAGAGREAALLAQDPRWLAQQTALMRVTPEAIEWVYAMANRMRALTFVAVAVVLLARLVRLSWQRRHGIVRIRYPNGREVRVARGSTVLAASRLHGIPHASVCGGRGRCSTCRIRIAGAAAELPPPSTSEQHVLNRLRAPAGVRLACQLRPTGDLAVVPMLPAAAQAREAYRSAAHLAGTERNIAILFADLRAFTRFSEGRLPYDVVFVINQYFRAMGQAIEGAGGRLDKFIGDGVMALFAVEAPIEQGCRSALEAARGMSLALDDLNRLLSPDLREPLRMGIGIHAGPAIVGEMGYRSAISVTAMGDAVNAASRLEGVSKELGCQLVLSARVAELAGVDLAAFPRHMVQVRGRAGELAVFAIADARDLPALPPAPVRRRGIRVSAPPA
ncbi:MAG: adenylate/guanylate cyclase domain-containing protein [Alphaproteobacteria bacterium]|nr:adenylate/guanylate cyclase domain-containing protein [Alphaproteobacteria bacterium]